MRTAVTKRWQTVIPAKIRKQHRIEEGAQLVWLDSGDTIQIVPIPANPLRALRGRGKGEQLVEKLLTARRQDRERET
jgi:AbrB family looped-hinge helix DNA binding protein